MQRIKPLFFISFLFLFINSVQSDMKKNTVLVCYGKMKPELVKNYKYIILESKHYLPSNIRVLKSQNEKVFAYISLGEVNKNAPHYSILKNNTLGKNKIWDSYYLDLNSKKTIEILMILVDELFAKGYDGLFLDNFDNFTIHGPQKEQKTAIVNLLKMIKEKYPNKSFIQNAGLDLIAETTNYVDAIAIESIATDYSFKQKKYSLREKSQYETLMNRLRSIHTTYDEPILLIEYANTPSLAKQVEDRIQNSNFDYFIGSIDLQSIPNFK